MSKHTPGPWVAGRPDMATIENGVDSKWVYAGDKYVALASGHASDEWDVVMANARLIAAAPDMAEALEEYLKNGDTERARRLAGKAIRKAEGEEVRND